MRGEPSVVIYDGECGLCLCARRFLEALDPWHSLKWIACQAPEARRFGIPVEEMRRSVQFVSGTRRWRGFDATKQIILRLPALYVIAAAAIRTKPVLVFPLALIFSPLFQPAGERLYAWVSENRHRMPRHLCGAVPAWRPAAF